MTRQRDYSSRTGGVKPALDGASGCKAIRLHDVEIRFDLDGRNGTLPGESALIPRPDGPDRAAALSLPQEALSIDMQKRTPGG